MTLFWPFPLSWINFRFSFKEVFQMLCWSFYLNQLSKKERGWMNEFTQTFVKRIKIVFATFQFVKNCLKVGFIFCFSFKDINSCFMKEKWSRSLSKGLNNLVFDLSWNVVTFSYWLFFTTADILMDSFCFSIKLYSLQGDATEKVLKEKLF